MKATDLQAIVSMGQQVFGLLKGIRHCNQGLLRTIQGREVTLSIPDETGQTIFSAVFRIEIDEAKLMEELEKINVSGSNTFEDEKSIDSFLEYQAIEVIQHLKSFNGKEDNYAAIAKLATPVYGAIQSKKFDI